MTDTRRWPKTPQDRSIESAPKIDWSKAARAILRRDVGVWFKFTDNRPNTRMGRLSHWRQELGEEFVSHLQLEAKAIRMAPRRDDRKSGYAIYLRKNRQEKAPELYRAEDAEPKVQASLESSERGRHVVRLYRIGHGELEKVYPVLKDAQQAVKYWNGASRLPGEKEES